MAITRFLECRVVATSNITLNGQPQTIDGVSVVTGNSVLAVGQTTASQNGVWTVAAGAWTRNGNASTQQDFLGMTVVVREGTAYADTMWQCRNDPTITVGTTALAFAQLPGVVDKALLNHLASLSTGTAKLAARLATTTNDSLTGLAARDAITPIAGDRILVTGQTTAFANGIYLAASGSWTRTLDFDTAAEMAYGAHIAVSDGAVNAGTLWIHSTTGPITIGTRAIKFCQVPNCVDKTRLDQLYGGINSTPVVLTDADQELTVAGGRRYRQSTAITAPRTKTLSTFGAVAGDIITIERSDGSTSPIAVVNGGAGAGTIAVLTGPRPTASFRYDGKNWAKHSQLPDTTSWPVFNVRDYGAKGDERLEDFAGEHAAIQACIDAAARFARAYAYVSGAVIEFPAGVYHTNGQTLILRRTPYNAPLVYRGAGIGTTTIQNSTTGDLFRVESITEEPDPTWGGNHHVFQDMSFSSPNGYNLIWDLGEEGDTFGGSGDPIRSSFFVDRCFFSRTTSGGACVRLRHPSRAKFTNCYFDVANYDAGNIGLEVIRGSASMIGCVGGGALMYVRDGGEINIVGCRAEGAWSIPGWDFLNVNGLTMFNTATEGHGEAHALYRFRGCKNLTLDTAQVAVVDFSYIVMRAYMSITGAPKPNITVQHLAGVGTAYAPQDMIIRSSGSWFDDKIANGSLIKLTNAVTNTAWYTVREATHDTLWVEETLVNESITLATGTGATVRPTLSGLPSVTFSNAGTITRAASGPSAAGSWIIDGFVNGQVVRTTSQVNKGPFTVTNVTDTVLTVAEAVKDEVPLAPVGVQANHHACGILFENCWNFTVRGSAGADFTQAGDQTRKTVEVGPGCRDGDITFALYNSIYDAISIANDAYNVVAEVRALSYTDWQTLNPGQSVTYWHGRKHFDGLEVGQPDGLQLNHKRNLSPNALCGVDIRRGFNGVDEGNHVGIWWDEANQRFTAAYDTAGVHTLDADLGARVALQILELLFPSTAIIRAAAGQTVNVYDDDTLIAFFQLIAGVGKLRSGTTNFEVTANGDITITPGDLAQISAGGNIDLFFGAGRLGLRLNAATGGTELYRVVPLANPQTGTGITTPQEGRATHGTTKRTFTFAAFSAADTSAFVRFDDLPPKTRVVSVIADTSATFGGGSALSSEIRVGTEDDDDGYILPHSVFSAAAVKGLLDVDRGTYLVSTNADTARAGHVPSWTDSKELRVQLDVTGDTLDHLTQGTVTVIVALEYLG